MRDTHYVIFCEPQNNGNCLLMVYYTLYLSLKANRQKLCWKVRIYADENLILILK